MKLLFVAFVLLISCLSIEASKKGGSKVVIVNTSYNGGKGGQGGWGGGGGWGGQGGWGGHGGSGGHGGQGGWGWGGGGGWGGWGWRRK